MKAMKIATLLAATASILGGCGIQSYSEWKKEQAKKAQQEMEYFAEMRRKQAMNKLQDVRNIFQTKESFQDGLKGF